MSDDSLNLNISMMHGLRGVDSPGIETRAFWAWYETIETVGIEQAHHMIVAATEHIAGPLSDDKKLRLRQLLEAIKADGAESNKREDALVVSYMMLQDHIWSREQAAEFARWMLGKQFQKEAWQKAVDKWAAERGARKLDLPHGRPSKKNRKID